MIKSTSSGLVLDVRGCNPNPKAQVIMWSRKSPKEGFTNQLWYEDQSTYTIRTALNNFCLDLDCKKYSNKVSDLKSGK